MKKLYRISLFAGVLAFGVAACGDDVQIVESDPPPPPALQVSLTPQAQTVAVGDQAVFAVGISGGAQGAQTTVTCASSNTSVASVSSSDTGCTVTGAAAGSASITVTVTRGNQTSNAGAQLTVVEDVVTQATVSISSITQGGTTADIDNIAGQLDVTMNVNPNDETLQELRLLVDGEVVASQMFTQAMLEEMREEMAAAEETAEAVQPITLSFRTARYDVDLTEGVATPRHLNGERVISAELSVVERPDEPAASNEITVIFNNDDGFHVFAPNFGDIPTAMDSQGRLWYGGPDFELAFHALPVLYSGINPDDLTVNVQLGPCGSDSAAGIPHLVEFSCAGVEDRGIAPFITSTVAGEPGPGMNADAVIKNLTVSADHPFPMGIDRAAPTGGSLVVVRQSGLNNTGNWVNSQYNFSGGYSAPTDGGVGGVTSSAPIIRDLNAGGAVVAAGDLEESVTNERYRLRRTAQDALGNSTTINQGANAAAGHPENTFGYDDTAPTVNLFEGDDALGQIEEAYNIINQFGIEDGIRIETTDNLSGFNPTYAATHAIVTARGEFQGEGAIETAALVGTSASSAPFTAARAGNNIATLASATPFVSFLTQTAFELEINDFGGVIATPRTDASARYYVYQVRLQDQAGNYYKDYRAVYLNNNSVPSVTNLMNPSMFDASAAFSASIARDSVEVFEGSLEVRYPNTLGTVVWERPTAEIVSALRMNAGIPDGELFTDEIHRPVNGVDFPLGFDALGIPFIKSIQSLAEASVATSKPDSVRARVYNGWGADQEMLNHSAPMAGGNGFSEIIRNQILDEEIADATIEYHATDIDIFRIVEQGQFSCTAANCVQAIGPLSTFTNPFAGGPVLIVWAEDDGAQNGSGINGELQWRVATIATPNFNNPFPTRDAGADRIYEWTYTLPAGVPADASIAAVGVNANTGDALLVADFFVAPDPEFSVGFSNSVDLVQLNGESDILQLEHGANSTEDAGTIIQPDSCVITDSSGNPVNFPPTGLEVTVVGTGCNVEVTDDTEVDVGTYYVLATASDGADTDTALGVVNIGLPDFTITMADVTGQVPLTGTVDFDHEVTLGTGGPISAWVCAVDGPGLTVDTYAIGGPPPTEVGCRVTATSGAEPGVYTVTVIAQEDETGRETSTTAELTLDAAFTVTVDPLEQTIERDDSGTFEITLDFGGNTPVGTTITCDLDSDLPAGMSVAEVAGDCVVTVDDDFDRAGGEFDFTISVTDGDVTVDTEVTVIVDEIPEFDPVLETGLGGLTADDRRETEREREPQWRVVDGFGFGLDDAASSAVVTPSASPPGATDVTADVLEVNGDILVRVDVPVGANPGTYDITVTFVEAVTGETVERELFIRVLDTGAVIIPDTQF